MIEYLAHLIVMFSVFATLVYAFNLLAGDGGLLAFCFGGIWGVGAYAAALGSVARNGAPYTAALGLTGGAGLEVTLPLAVAAGALAGSAAGLGSLRFRGDAFILATLAIQALIVSAFENVDSLTRGPAGLYGLPPALLFGRTLSLPALALLAGTMTALTATALVRLRYTAFGLQLRALRDHERAARALGVSPTATYLMAYTIAGGFAGLAGGLYVARASYIDPASFALPESILIVTALLIGGRGTVLGPLAGALIIVLTPEMLRFAGFDLPLAATARGIIMAALLVVIALSRPGGLTRGEQA